MQAAGHGVGERRPLAHDGRESALLPIADPAAEFEQVGVDRIEHQLLADDEVDDGRALGREVGGAAQVGDQIRAPPRQFAVSGSVRREAVRVVRSEDVSLSASASG
ncbi:MAG TPA: hypothetical protein VFD92_01250 [Candidatus Binatia bacterium]|nr:hypothetical protein [Candidatus Binatia bacterium]